MHPYKAFASSRLGSRPNVIDTLQNSVHSDCAVRLAAGVHVMVTLETSLAKPNHTQFLCPHESTEQLRRQAARQSDTEAARHMQTAKQKLFASFRKRA